MKTVIILVLKLFYLVPGFYITLRKFSKNKDKYPLDMRNDYIKDKLRLILRKANTTVIVTGEENIPSESFVMYPNHQSNFDPLLVLANFDRPMSIVGKKQLEHVVLVGDAFRSLDGLFMDRDDVKQSIGVIKEVAKRVKDGSIYLIFAEGTRSLSPTMLPFKPGAFQAAMRAKAPVLPICIDNGFAIMEKPTKNPVVSVNYLKPLYYDDYKDLSSVEVAAIVESRIQEKLDEIHKKS